VSTNSRLKTLNVVGARPNFMKVAPLMREYMKHPDRISPLLVHTGQHYDEGMSSVFFSELQIPEPDVFLGVGSGSHASQTAKVMELFEPVLLRHRPDLLVVVGDVNSTLAASIVAAKIGVPIAHVEAGLRSRDRTMPEEINRLVTDSLGDFLLTTSRDANDNLRREGIPEKRIHFVGNTMIDTMLMMKPFLKSSTVKKTLRLDGNAFAYMTLHRPSNVDNKTVLTGICEAVLRLQANIRIVWPLHPRTKKMLVAFDLLNPLQHETNIILCEPLSYLDSLSLMSDAKFVMTDSGGIQEETTVLGVPCLTLRENTERPITITEGTNELVGTDKDLLVKRGTSLIAGETRIGRIPELWDGRSSERIVSLLLNTLS